MSAAKDAIIASLIKSFEAGQRHETPYRHWFVQNCLPADVVEQTLHLPFEAPALGGISGKREVHNATRK